MGNQPKMLYPDPKSMNPDPKHCQVSHSDFKEITSFFYLLAVLLYEGIYSWTIKSKRFLSDLQKIPGVE
jgi:hypothetical protein